MLNRPKLPDVLKRVEDLLTGFEPTELVYLGPQGKWAKNPRQLRDRISNELWFRIWESRHHQADQEQVRNIICPLMRDESSWEITKRIFDTISEATNTARDGLLIIFEVLYHLIEYDAEKSNSQAYVSDWNSAGKGWRARCLQGVEKFASDLRRILPDDAQLDAFREALDLLKQARGSIFGKVSAIIAEEERVRNQIDGLLARPTGAEGRNAPDEVIPEQMDSAIKGLTQIPGSLTRPCLQLLTDPDIDVCSGFPYQASGLLGALKDIRSTETLLNSLRTSDPGHTSLRCNLVYALGNLRQKRALKQLIDVLENPDSIHVPSAESSSGYDQPLSSEKQEAIWALGKLGHDAVEAIPALAKYSQSPHREMRISLAWAIGTIGQGQKSKYDGVDAAIVTTLMHLLAVKDRDIFEEAAVALRKLGLPNFLHTLYLHNFVTTTVLSLKPSSTGLYELSETIFHLLSVKKPVVMAVTGDSGTGKTYFCESIVNGFGGLRANEILYLQRDHPRNMRILNRILGVQWLRGHVDQFYYQDYPLSENEDDPDEFFDAFLRDHSHARLIILDGWRDEPYFHQIVRTFYEKGYLDVLVKFRTSFSTRRINLEERDGSLESVKTHLSLVEEPILEETSFYREGAVLIYNLDNSISSRLNAEEIGEVFQRKKIDGWVDHIRIGEFDKNAKPLSIHRQALSSRWEEASVETQPFSQDEVCDFAVRETTFARILNEDISEEPHLLQVIKLQDLSINRIAFYNQGQIACGCDDGTVGILTGFNNRVFYHRVQNTKVGHLAVVGGNICSVDGQSALRIISFHRNTHAIIGIDHPPICSLTSHRDDRILTGHEDGTVRIWNIPGQQVNILGGLQGSVCAVVVDRRGRVFSGSADGQLRMWDFEAQKVKVFLGQNAPIRTLGLFPDGRVVMATDVGGTPEKGKQIAGVEIKIVDADSGDCEVFGIMDAGPTTALNVYFDGRIILGLTSPAAFGARDSLLVIDPRPGFLHYSALRGHRLKTRDCLTMGPRIVTCGNDGEDEKTLRIWGTERYVQREIEKLALLPESVEKPPHYRTLF